MHWSDKVRASILLDDDVHLEINVFGGKFSRSSVIFISNRQKVRHGMEKDFEFVEFWSDLKIKFCIFNNKTNILFVRAFTQFCDKFSIRYVFKSRKTYANPNKISLVCTVLTSPNVFWTYVPRTIKLLLAEVRMSSNGVVFSWIVSKKALAWPEKLFWINKHKYYNEYG